MITNIMQHSGTSHDFLLVFHSNCVLYCIVSDIASRVGGK